MPDLTPGLGAKIRELRLRRGMTQKELAGERISRNMLSLIESGSASPSVATLCYLAERLDTPVGAFFLSPEFDRQYKKLSVIDGIKARFSEKDWRGCEALCGEVPAELIDDEIALLLAVSCLMNAAQSAAALDLRAAARELDKAGECAEKSLYCGADFERAVRYNRELIATAASDEITDVLCDARSVGEFVPYALVNYFVSLRELRANRPAAVEQEAGSPFERHLSALRSRPAEAVKRLRELSLSPTLPYFMRYRVLCDLERFANETEDLRLAYSSSRRKIELIDKMRF